jgi:hypothetical protein
MRKAMLGLAVPLMLLAGCSVEAGNDDSGNGMASLKVGEDGNVSITATDGADGVSVSIPGFDAKLKVPGVELGGDDMDIDGMKLYPGSEVKGINVTDQKGAGNSRVEMRFTSPATPDKIAAYFEAAARDQGFTEVKVANSDGAATFTAKQTDGDDVTIVMNRAAGGTTAGQILIRGQK